MASTDDESTPSPSDASPPEPGAAHSEGATGLDGSRRRFMIAGAGALGACVAGVTAVPAAAVLSHPLRVVTTRGADQLIEAGRLTQLRTKTPTKVDLYADVLDAWNRVQQVKVGSAWVFERDGELLALSTVCPHLGCAIDYDGEQDVFVCPCHDSAFALDGAVQAGPSPRAMDSLAVETEDERVSIRYQRFVQGIEDKEPV